MKLLRAREGLALSQRDLARIAGVSATLVALAEAGLRRSQRLEATLRALRGKRHPR